ncbi:MULTISPECIES: hypothetical protein [unclassified Phenylobacterium]|uniref:hypothetical protein n=1 Tax=unclassified Phenylobacterium TaxID=2640670 RepID=UPI00083A1278|nr:MULTISPECIES: hypothetical protein [unclassified Phenylobacterium]
MTDLDTAATGTSRRTDQAKELVGQAGHALKAEAQSFASAAQERVRAEAQKGAQAGARTLGDFANAVRRAGDELASADQSPASRLVQQAADGLENLSRSLADKEPGDLLNAVRDFGRKNPAAFIGGAVLVGLAVGRFARAAEPDHSSGLDTEPLELAETDPYAGPLAAPQDAGVDSSIAQNMGSLEATEPTTESSIGLAADDTLDGEPDAITSPHTGGR